MPFEKSRSGNPGGRPKMPDEVKRLARSKAKSAFERLVALLESKNERVVFAAAQEILNRAYGRPAPAVTGEDGTGPVEIAEIRFRIVDPANDPEG